MPSRANIDRLPDRLVRRSIIADAWNRMALHSRQAVRPKRPRP